MTDPRNPLITGVTNDAGYRGDDKLPTSYAVNQLFAGANIPANTSADTLMACGNYRFNTTTTSLPTHMLTKTGILTVMHDRPALPTNNNYGGNPSSSGGSASVIRQVAWPDDKDDVTPYTRTYQNGSWGEWQTMGGGLRRVKLESNLGNTANNEAKSLPNVMYYSFGNYTLTLPKTDKLPYGSKIGLEQWGGEGAVASSEQWTVQLTAGNINKYVNGRYPKSATEDGQYTEAMIRAEDVGSYIKESFMQVTSPAYESDLDGALTDIYIGPQVYQFEIVDNDGTKTWMMDVDNNIANTIAGIRRDIQTIGAASDRADRDFRELIGNDFAMPYYAWKNGNTVLYTTHYAPTAGVAKAYSSKTVLSDQTVFGTVSALVRDSRQLITGIVVNGTTYIRSAEDDNTSNTISNKFAKETVDRAAADTELSNRLGSGVNTNITAALGTSGTATAQLTLVKNLIGTGVAETPTITNNIDRANLGVAGGGTITNQFSLVKDLFGYKIDKANSVTTLLGTGVTNSDSATIGTAGTVTAQFLAISNRFGSGIDTTTNSAIQVSNLGSSGTVTRQFEIVKGLLGTGITTATGSSVSLGTAGTVTAQFSAIGSQLSGIDGRFGAGIATAPTNITNIDYEQLATTSAGTVTNQLALVKELFGSSISKSSNVSALLGTGITTDSSVTSQLTTLSNRLGSGITTSSTGTATAQITAINNKIGSANVYGEGAAISNSDGKTITELISNKGPRTLIYVVSSAIGANSEFKDANNDTYKFPALLNRINPTIVVNSPNGFLITLPAASNYKTVASGTNATVIHGAKCTIEVPVGHKVTVTDESQTEEFDNTGGSSTLVLPFEATTNASGTLIWQLLVVG